MKKRKMFLAFGMIIILTLIGCAFAIKPTVVHEEKYIANYDKMFEAAINAGAGLGYHPEFKDKKQGMIKLLKKVMTNEYRITVQFGKLESYGGKLGFQVSGQAAKDIVNPFISNEVQKITDAINKAAEIEIKTSNT